MALLLAGLALLAEQGWRYIAAGAPFDLAGLAPAEAGQPWEAILAGLALAAGVILVISGSRRA